MPGTCFSRQQPSHPIPHPGGPWLHAPGCPTGPTCPQIVVARAAPLMRALCAARRVEACRWGRTHVLAQVQRRLRAAGAPRSYVLTPISPRTTRLAAAAAADAAGDGSQDQVPSAEAQPRSTQSDSVMAVQTFWQKQRQSARAAPCTAEEELKYLASCPAWVQEPDKDADVSVGRTCTTQACPALQTFMYHSRPGYSSSQALLTICASTGCRTWCTV